jgi:signal transduction histidine kinase/ActR/RegA family two-component response regulator
VFQYGDSTLLALIAILALLLLVSLITQIRLRKQVEKLQREQLAKKPQPVKPVRRQDHELSRREVEKQIAELKAKFETAFAEERVKVDRALTELERQREISKIASTVSKEQAKKIQFFTELAQDFREPVYQLMRSMEEVLAGNYGKIPGRIRKQFETTLRNSRHLVRFANQFHDISHLQSGKMEITRSKQDLIRFVREIVQTVAWYAEKKKIDLKFETEVDELEAHFDVKKMAEVFYHLLSNAFKFTGENGKILIRVGQISADEEFDEDSARISVRNSGKAIPEETLPYIFNPFQRSDKNRPRFGLSLVKELVSLHGGSIQVRSEPDIGTEFTIVLPRGRRTSQEVVESKAFDFSEQARMEISMLESDDQEPPKPAPNESALLGNILIVEDNDSLRELLKGGLREYYVIREAKNGVEAMEKVRELRPNLIISDVMMSEMDGLDFCRQVKRDPDLNQIPVILITAKSTETGRLEGFEAGADAYIAKPFGFEELLRKVEHLTKQSMQTKS